MMLFAHRGEFGLHLQSLRLCRNGGYRSVLSRQTPFLKSDPTDPLVEVVRQATSGVRLYNSPRRIGGRQGPFLNPTAGAAPKCENPTGAAPRSDPFRKGDGSAVMNWISSEKIAALIVANAKEMMVIIEVVVAEEAVAVMDVGDATTYIHLRQTRMVLDKPND